MFFIDSFISLKTSSCYHFHSISLFNYLRKQNSLAGIRALVLAVLFSSVTYIAFHTKTRAFGFKSTVLKLL